MLVDEGFALGDALFLGLDFELAGVGKFFDLFALVEGFLVGFEARLAEEGVGLAFAVLDDLLRLRGERALAGAVEPAREQEGGEGTAAEERGGFRCGNGGQEHYGKSCVGISQVSQRAGVAR